MSSSTISEAASVNLLRQAGVKYRDQVALSDAHSETSYSTLFNRADEIGKAIRQLGIPKHSIIVLDDLTPYELIHCFWACSLHGYIAFPLNTRFPFDKLLTTVAHVKPALIITNRSFSKFTSMNLMQLLARDPEAARVLLEPIDPESGVSLLMTSGSSSTGKIVQHSHANHTFSAQGSNENIGLESGDRWLVSLPLYHVGGLSILHRTALVGACTVIPGNNESIGKAVETYLPTHLSLVSTQFQRLLDHFDEGGSPPGIKAILLGGSALSEHLVKRGLDHGLPLYLSYGSTEMASQITTTGRLQNPYYSPLSSGKVLSGRDLLISYKGEVLVRGRTLAQGYLIENKVVDLRDNDGWFHTGDVGYLDFSQNLTITGRLDNLFISGGENIQPEHIEAALLKDPRVEVAVVIPQESSEFGFRPIAFLKLTGPGESQEGICSRLRSMLPSYMIPTEFYHLPDQLLTGQLKTPRKELEAFCLDPNNHLHSLP